MRIAVLGAGGQLGAAIVAEFSEAAHDVVAFAHAQVDITDDAAVARAIEAAGPDAVINCAAFNDVDAAEDQPANALAINAFGVRAIVNAAERVGAALFHYGTDFVFDGTATEPYTETDHPSPRSVYAASKMLGEWFALEAPRGYVLRVESLFGRVANGPPSRGSVATIARNLLAGTPPRVFEDRTVSATYLLDAARATRQLLEMGTQPGLYHCVNSGHCTWLEFAVELARQLGVEPRVSPVRLDEVTLRAQRPRYCALSNAKLLATGIVMPNWQDAISRFVRDGVHTPSITG